MPVPSPDLWATFILEALLLLAIGLGARLLIKKVLKIGIIIAAVLLLIIAAGFARAAAESISRQVA
jgi:hypothetical protein